MILHLCYKEMKMKLFTDSNLDQTKYRCLPGSIITLEGLIGAGKSTLGIALESYLKSIGLEAKFFPEYVCKPLLNQYIANMPKYAYPFQIIMLQKRFEIYHRAHEYSLTGGIAIVDRSLIGDYTFAKMQHDSGHISDSEMEVYLEIMRGEKTIEPTSIIYLDCKPDIAFNRMINRGIISEQNGYQLKYFIELNTAYQNTLEETAHNIIRIDWNEKRSTEDPRELSKPILDKIRDQL